LALSPAPSCEWLAPRSLEEALALKAERGEDATVLAGGTFLGILINQRLVAPTCLLSLGGVPGLDGIDASDELHLGAMARHRSVERAQPVWEGWPALARAFSLVASPRVRNQATVGGVLADADYASDPPAMLCALRARAVARSTAGERELPIDELITGYYETSLRADELITSVSVPRADRAVYRKFRSRSHEDRPCVSVAAALHGDELRVVVGAVAGTLQQLPDACALASGSRLDAEVAAEIGSRYSEAIEPLSDVRGSAAYRKRVIAVEVRRALLELRGAA
jgi:carbon-monoxide dehydrogenase medium subunit